LRDLNLIRNLINYQIRPWLSGSLGVLLNSREERKENLKEDKLLIRLIRGVGRFVRPSDVAAAAWLSPIPHKIQNAHLCKYSRFEIIYRRIWILRAVHIYWPGK